MKYLPLFITLLCFLSPSITVEAQEQGKASYYSDDFAGGRTYFGEIYDPNKMTAAHKVHPKGTRLKVTHLGNAKSVIVRVNDRGPYISGRIIEISRAAASRLGMLNSETADVTVEVVSLGGNTPQEEEQQQETEVARRTTTNTPNTSPATTPATEQRTRTVEPEPATTPSTQAVAKPTSNPVEDNRNVSPTERARAEEEVEAKRMVRNNAEYGLFEIKVLNVENSGYGVQVASLGSYDNVMKMINKLQSRWFDDIFVAIEKGPGSTKTYKVIIGKFDERAKAENYRKNIQKKHKDIKGFVIALSEVTP